MWRFDLDWVEFLLIGAGVVTLLVTALILWLFWGDDILMYFVIGMACAVIFSR